jgi:hypothetical protein
MKPPYDANSCLWLNFDVDRGGLVFSPIRKQNLCTPCALAFGPGSNPLSSKADGREQQWMLTRTENKDRGWTAPSAKEQSNGAKVVKFPKVASFPIWKSDPGKHRELIDLLVLPNIDLCNHSETAPSCDRCHTSL